jgi:hypothetical protein
MFESMTKNSSFSCFMDVFMRYCQQFWGSMAIYMFESYDQKLIFLRFMDVFMSYSPYFWDFRAFYML